MKNLFLLLSVVMASIFAGPASALTSAEYNAQKDRIDADYKAGRSKCGELSANAKDICMSEVRGIQKVAKAELDAQYKPSDKRSQNVAMVKADTAYNTAKEKCDDLAANAKDVCVKDAKAVHVKAKEEAKIVKAVADSNMDKANTINDAKQEATSEMRAANYKAAVERCDALAGMAKDTCVSEAKAKYGM